MRQTILNGPVTVHPPDLARIRTQSGGIHQTVIKPDRPVLTILVAMYNEPMSFDVVPGTTAQTRIFQVHGPITLGNLFDFQKTLMAGTENVTIVDLTDSPYMDSAGLGAVLKYYVSAKRRGRFIRLVGVNYRIMELLKLTSSHTLVHTYESVQAAESAAS